MGVLRFHGWQEIFHLPPAVIKNLPHHDNIHWRVVRRLETCHPAKCFLFEGHRLDLDCRQPFIEGGIEWEFACRTGRHHGVPGNDLRQIVGVIHELLAHVARDLGGSGVALGRQGAEDLHRLAEDGAEISQGLLEKDWISRLGSIVLTVRLVRRGLDRALEGLRCSVDLLLLALVDIWLRVVDFIRAA